MIYFIFTWVSVSAISSLAEFHKKDILKFAFGFHKTILFELKKKLVIWHLHFTKSLQNQVSIMKQISRQKVRMQSRRYKEKDPTKRPLACRPVRMYVLHHDIKLPWKAGIPRIVTVTSRILYFYWLRIYRMDKSNIYKISCIDNKKISAVKFVYSFNFSF